jgi:catechol 2,3-dioxygenase-like lactoylglutathione lyase family enzyme
MPIRVKSIRHVLVPTSDLADTSRFYFETVGLNRVKEPPTGYAFKMAWFGSGGPEVHVVQQDPGVTEITKSDFNPTLQPAYRIRG